MTKQKIEIKDMTDYDKRKRRQLVWWFTALAVLMAIIVTYFVPTIESTNPITKGLLPLLVKVFWVFPLMFLWLIITFELEIWWERDAPLKKRPRKRNHKQQYSNDKAREQQRSADAVNNSPANHQQSARAKEQPANHQQSAGAKEQPANQRQEKIDYIRGLSPLEFESFIAKVYENKGYRIVSQNHSRIPEPDGGVDIRLEKSGKCTLVQCKKWSAKNKVDVKVVRELFGVVAQEEADYGFVVSSSYYTQPAIDFAATTTGIKLIDIKGLIKLASAEITEGIQKAGLHRAEMQKDPLCPKCESKMVQRTAAKGSRSGKRFWGCTNYAKSKCDGIINIDD